MPLENNVSNKKLVQYIKDTLKKGFSKADIENALLQRGYTEDTIRQAFLQVNSRNTNFTKTNKAVKNKQYKPPNKKANKSVKTNIPNKKYGLPIAAFILSLIPVFSLIGLILGIVSLVKIKKNPALKGKGFAIAAIVISSLGLIFTALVFGLGLSFVRNVFGPSLQEPHMLDIGKQTLIENPPTQDKPFTLSKAELFLMLGEELTINAGFYNKFNESVESSLDIHSCYTKGKDTTDQISFTTTQSKEVAANDTVAFPAIITASKTASSAIHACTLVITAKPIGSQNEEEKFYQDILITIKSNISE
ncbi:MAG: hypothetical protein MAG795_00813 [Candidatus Woesearchaeota archaeon]|nr:hypothetical protein [Candidatus Woesearchaeota archaeon]